MRECSFVWLRRSDSLKCRCIRPLDDAAPFERVASLFRASSRQQLDMPTLHDLARSKIEKLFPSDPETFVRARLSHAEEALVLAEMFDIPSVSLMNCHVVPHALLCARFAKHCIIALRRTPKKRKPPLQIRNTQRPTPSFPQNFPAVATRCSNSSLHTLLPSYSPSLQRDTWRAPTSSRRSGCRSSFNLPSRTTAYVVPSRR